MDNNMIKIDDLVRQRLLGGEEHERAGAWGRMNELLEKEMPRKRGIILWRRMFGGLAILALLGGLGLGGYELNSFVRNQNGGSSTGIADATLTASSSNHTGDAVKTAASSDMSNEQPAARTAADKPQSSISKTNSRSNTQHQTENNNKQNPATGIVAASTVNNNSNNTINHSSTQKASNNNNNNSNNTNQNQAKESSVAVSKTATNNNSNSDNNITNSNKETNTTSTISHSAEVASVVSDKAGQTKATTPASSPSEKGTHNKVAVTAVATTADANKHVTENKKQAFKKHSRATTSHVAATTSTATTTTPAAEAEHLPAAADETTARTINTPAEHPVAGAENKQPKKQNDKKIAAHKTTGSKNGLPVLSSSVPSSDNKKTQATHTTADETAGQPEHIAAVTHHTKAATKTAGVNTKTIVPAATSIAKPNGSSVSKLPVAAKTTAPAQTTNANGNEKELPVVSTRKGTRTIEKMVIFQKSIRNADRAYTLHLDTISQETISQEYDLALGLKKNAQKTGTEVAASPDADGDSSPFKPGASSSSESSSFAAKDNKGKISKGSMALENLSAAFNDIKFHASKATFAMGATAGINGTFFGPNSFKGFQFGITGKLTFSDALALMGELKYFHRINNGYTLNDDYYTYTPAAGGGYVREKVLNPYSISTLHSLELPISLRYSKGNFDFFFGPNVVYTFSINAGEYPTTQQSAQPVIVAAPGNDTKGQINAGDFNSRFGLGYLFGVSYQISPKVSIDLRDVQTIWDNASTDGAKRISSQLYRSPSFQLSIGYRFGGNKDK